MSIKDSSVNCMHKYYKENKNEKTVDQSRMNKYKE